LSKQINNQLAAFDILVNDEINAFNATFNTKKLNYLFVED